MQQHLKDKLVILVTHQLQYLKRADQILILNEGTVQIQGTYEEIKRSGLSFAQLLEEATMVSVQPEQEKEMDKVLKAISLISTAFNSAIDIEGLKVSCRAKPKRWIYGWKIRSFCLTIAKPKNRNFEATQALQK